VPAIAVNVGNVIGTGIFLKTRVMTCNVGASTTVIAVWVIGGLLALAGAFAYSEVAAMTPEAGGEYVYLRRAYGRLVSFLCGWTFFTLARCGSQAALAVGFAIFMNVAVGGALSRPLFEVPIPGHPLHITLLTVVAAGSIWVIAFLNCRAVARGGQTALGLTSIKVLFLLGLASAALLFGHGDFHHFSESNVGGACEGVADGSPGSALPCSVRCGPTTAGSNVAPLLGEIRNPARNIPRVFTRRDVCGARSLLARHGGLLLRAVAD
jgi:APA family basic amino acid/polyamine antiporter